MSYPFQDYAKKTRPSLRKPMISITRNRVLGTTIVFRSPFSRRWLGNITLAPKRETLEIEASLNYGLAKVGMVLTLIAVAVTWGMR